MKNTFKSLLGIVLMSTLSCMGNPEKKEQQKIALAEMSTANSPSKRYIKVALLLDTSNSMDGLIDQAKSQLWKIVNELSYAKCDDQKPNLQIALYEYGNDGLNSKEGYIRQVLNFSEDLDDISKELFSLTTNGGNEFCGQVIQSSLNQLQWGNNPDDLKLIFIAGNEPFTQGRVNYQSATEQALNKNISVNTIFCGDYNQGISTYWKDGADRGNGNYMAINHNHKTTYVATPFDDQILQLNKKLNTTYIAYGAIGDKKMALQAEQDNNAQGYGSANAVSRTLSKSSHLYKNASWDLVDASSEDDFDYNKLDDNDLPEELKGKSQTEIKSYIENKREQRHTIKTQIQELNKKRSAYIKKQNQDNNNGLENAMVTAIKTQAKAKQYKW